MFTEFAIANIFKLIIFKDSMKLGRKKTGGRYKSLRKKRLSDRPGIERIVKVRTTKKKILRVRGGNKKPVLLSCEEANIIDKKGKAKVTKILSVVETSANRFWARQNRLVKGAIIETEAGKAKITNRPSQEGCVNAVLIDETSEKKK